MSIALLTAFVSYPYAEGMVIFGLVQLVLRGTLSSTAALMLGSIITVVLLPLLFIWFRKFIAALLSSGRIIGSGCLVGLIVYPVSVVLALVGLWHTHELGIGFISLLAVPFICFAAAWIITIRTPGRNRR